MSDLMPLETEKAFEHAVTLAAGFVANGKVHYHLGDLSSGDTVDEREVQQRDEVADLIHTMYGAVLQARKMVRRDHQTRQ